MTDAHSTPSGSSIASRLRAARQQSGLQLEAAAAAASLPSGVLAAMEAGERRPVPAEIDQLAVVYGTDLSDVLPTRRPLQVDAGTGRIGIDSASRRVRDLRDDDAVYAAYLSLLLAVRGAQPGEHVSLRSSDVDLLMSVLGEDAETIERRLVALMGCSPAEASLLRRVLLRHRALATAVGVAAVLGLAATGPGADDVSYDTSAPVHATVTEDVQVATETPVSAVAGVPVLSAGEAATASYGLDALLDATHVPVVSPVDDAPATVGGAPDVDEPAAGAAPVEVPGRSAEPDPAPAVPAPTDEPAPVVVDEPPVEEPDLGAAPVPEPPAVDPAPVVGDPAPVVVDPAPVVVAPTPVVVPPEPELEQAPVVVQPAPQPVVAEPQPESEPVVVTPAPETAPEPVVVPPVVVEPAPEPVVVAPAPEPIVVEPTPVVVAPDPVVVTPQPPAPAPPHPSSHGQGKPNKNK